jgi:type I site-specific restriction endonuclease
MIDSYNTRRNKIDVLIQEAGWDIHKASQVILDVDTFQSSNSEVRKYTVGINFLPYGNSNIIL